MALPVPASPVFPRQPHTRRHGAGHRSREGDPDGSGAESTLGAMTQSGNRSVLLPCPACGLRNQQGAPAWQGEEAGDSSANARKQSKQGPSSPVLGRQLGTPLHRMRKGLCSQTILDGPQRFPDAPMASPARPLARQRGRRHQPSSLMGFGISGAARICSNCWQKGRGDVGVCSLSQPGGHSANKRVHISIVPPLSPRASASVIPAYQ